MEQLTVEGGCPPATDNLRAVLPSAPAGPAPVLPSCREATSTAALGAGTDVVREYVLNVAPPSAANANFGAALAPFGIK